MLGGIANTFICPLSVPTIRFSMPDTNDFICLTSEYFLVKPTAPGSLLETIFSYKSSLWLYILNIDLCMSEPTASTLYSSLGSFRNMHALKSQFLSIVPSPLFTKVNRSYLYRNPSFDTITMHVSCALNAISDMNYDGHYIGLFPGRRFSTV